MDVHVHLDEGTRVINAKTGRRGIARDPHYLARDIPHDEICVQYDGETSYPPVLRHEIEYEGSTAYAEAMKRFGHAA